MTALAYPMTASVVITVPNSFITVTCGTGDSMRLDWVSPGSVSGTRIVKQTTEDVGPFADNTVVTLTALSGAPDYTQGRGGSFTDVQTMSMQNVMSGATLTLTLTGGGNIATASKVGGRSYVFTDPDATHEVCTASDGAVLTVTKDGSGRAISLTGNFQ